MSIDNVEDISPQRQYVAAVGQTAFDYPFPIFENADLVVDVDGIILTLDDDYTVTGAGNDTGGAVTLLVALAGGEIVTIYRDIAMERTSDFQSHGPLASSTFNDELDKLYLLLQQLKRDVNRGLRIPLTAEVDSDDISLDPSNFGNFYLTFDADGKPTAAALSATAMTQATIAALLNPRTQSEISGGQIPTNKEVSVYPYYDVRRLGAVQNGTDQTSVVNAAILAVAGSQTLGTSGGVVYVPMGVGVTLTSLVLKKNVTVVIETGQERIVLSTGFNVSGAVNENWFSSQLHPAVIVDAHDDLTGPALGAGQVLSYRCSFLWAANRTTYWQFAMDIDAVKSKDLTLYTNSSSRQIMHFNHATGAIRYGRRTSVQDFTAPIFAHTLCQNTAVVGDDTADITFAFVQLQSGVKEDTATVTHQKLFQLDHTNGELVIIDDAATSIIWRLSNAGRLRSAQGIGGGSFTTAQRNAFTGLVSADRGIMVYDTTLTKPVWLDSVGPLVWHDASGAVV